MEEIWKAIQKHQGETFETVTHKSFTYQVIGDYLITSRTHARLYKNNFKKALAYHPDHVGAITNKVAGSSYVFSILSDPRIHAIRSSENNKHCFLCFINRIKEFLNKIQSY